MYSNNIIHKANKEAFIQCQLCNRPVDMYVDGKTYMGPWAYMCLQCFKVYGRGLGTGKGQRYFKGTKVSG